MKVLKENFKRPHILIIGSGIIGKFNALELSELGFQITIADPHKNKNSSSAALGLLMGYIYQKRKGRSWELRKQSNELWPKWINYLKQYNPDLKIETPLIQLTTNTERYAKLSKFVSDHPNQHLEVLEENSEIIKNINNIFKIKNLGGIISYKDGRIDPIALLKTLDICLKSKNINFIDDEIIRIKKVNNQWISTCKNTYCIATDAIVMCNSLNALKLINYKSNITKLKPILGQAIELSFDEKNSDLLSLPNHFSINGKNVLLINKHKIIIGSTEEYNMQPNPNVFEKLTDFVEEKPKWLNKDKITNKWFGIRSRPEGEPSPILKSLEKGLILCTGFYKNGILLAPACSMWISKEIKKHFL